jgi:uncharacterized integral membrane protein
VREWKNRGVSSERSRPPKVIVRGTGFLWGFAIALPLAAALIVFIAQNTEQVTVHWTVWRVRSSLAVVVLVTIAAAILLAELVGLVWRHRRRRLIARQESLRAELSGETLAPELTGSGETPPDPALDDAGGVDQGAQQDGSA